MYRVHLAAGTPKVSILAWWVRRGRGTTRQGGILTARRAPCFSLGASKMTVGSFILCPRAAFAGGIVWPRYRCLLARSPIGSNLFGPFTRNRYSPGIPMGTKVSLTAGARHQNVYMKHSSTPRRPALEVCVMVFSSMALPMILWRLKCFFTSW